MPEPDVVPKPVFHRGERDRALFALAILALGERPATVPSLIDLFRRDRELFFALACVGAGADTEPSVTPEGRPRVKPGTLRLMIFEPQRSAK